MFLKWLRFLMIFYLKSGKAVITSNDEDYKSTVKAFTNYQAKLAVRVEDLALDLAKALAKAKAKAEASALAKAKAIEREPLSITLLKIEQEKEAFIDSVQNKIKSVNGGRLEFTLSVEEYMAKNSIRIYNEMNKLIVKYNDAITTFVNANESKLKFKYNQYSIIKSFETYTNCTCGGGSGGTCIIFKDIPYHFHEDFMALCGFKNFAIKRRDEHNASATYRP